MYQDRPNWSASMQRRMQSLCRRKGLKPFKLFAENHCQGMGTSSSGPFINPRSPILEKILRFREHQQLQTRDAQAGIIPGYDFSLGTPSAGVPNVCAGISTMQRDFASNRLQSFL
ncbi:MAG: hypothetical protein DMG49_08475, partial [Acidobacteria bacterium]